MSITENTTTEEPSNIRAFNFQVSVRAILATILVGTCCSLHLMGKEVEEPLYSAVLMVLGLYFGNAKQAKPQ